MYRIVVKDKAQTTIDNQTIYNLKVTQTKNKSDFFSVNVTPETDISVIKPLVTIIDVYDEDDIIFRGRANNRDNDLYNLGVINFEGALSFLNDSQYPPFEWTGTPKELLASVLENHNAMMPDEKKIYLGNVTVTDPNNYLPRSSKDYKSSLNIINEKLVNSLGGYLVIRYEGNLVYLDWLAEREYVNSQNIEYAENILDLNIEYDYKNIITRLIPLGALDDVTGERLTISEVNGGSIYIDNLEGISNFGIVEGVVIFDDITNANNLLSKGTKYSESVARERVTITLSAVDLHNADTNIEKFHLGDWTHVIVPSHSINAVYQINEIQRVLDDRDKSKIVIGDLEQTSSSSTRNYIVQVQDSVTQYISQINAVKITTTALETDVAAIKDAVIGKAFITDLEAEELIASKGYITSLEAESMVLEKGYISKLEADTIYSTLIETDALRNSIAEIDTLLSGSVSAASAHTIVLNSKNTTIENALIKDAMIDSVTANKVKSGIIDTDLVTIQSADGSMTLFGTIQQFKDENGVVRIQIGKDSGGNFTFILYDDTGQGVLIDQTGIQSSEALADGLIVDSKVANNAAIHGSKLAIDTVVEEINDSSSTIKSNKIYFDEQNQTLDVVFSEINTTANNALSTANTAKITSNEALANSEDAQSTAEANTTKINEITTTVETNSTAIKAANDEISTLITRVTQTETDIETIQDDVTIAEENITSLTTNYSSVKNTVDGHTQTIASHTTTISELRTANNELEQSIIDVDDKVATVQVNLDTFRTEISENITTIQQDIVNANSRIDETAISITESYTSLINQTKDQLDLLIKQVQATATSNSESIVSINNQISLTAEDIALVKTTTQLLEDLVNGKIDEATVREWARFDGAELELGASNSEFKAILTNTELGFWQGNTRVAWISNYEMHVLKAVIGAELGVDKFRIFKVETSNGNYYVGNCIS